jgi:hypothetical protein
MLTGTGVEKGMSNLVSNGEASSTGYARSTLICELEIALRRARYMSLAIQGEPEAAKDGLKLAQLTRRVLRREGQTNAQKRCDGHRVDRKEWAGYSRQLLRDELYQVTS